MAFRFDVTHLRRMKVILQVMVGCNVFHNSTSTIRIEALCKEVPTLCLPQKRELVFILLRNTLCKIS